MLSTVSESGSSASIAKTVAGSAEKRSDAPFAAPLLRYGNGIVTSSSTVGVVSSSACPVTP